MEVEESPEEVANRAGASEMTGSGRCYTPKELEARRRQKEVPIEVEKKKSPMIPFFNPTLKRLGPLGSGQNLSLSLRFVVSMV